MSRRRAMIMGGEIAPRYIGASTSGNDTGAFAINLTKPSGVVDGHILLALIGVGASAATITPPTGWTEEATYTAGSNTAKLFSRVASSEGASWEFDGWGSSYRVWGGVCAYRYYNDVDVAGTIVYGAGGTAFDATSITATNSGILIGLYAGSASTAGNAVDVFPSGMTQRYDTFNSDGAFGVCDLDPSATGATGNKTFDPDNSMNRGVAVLVQLYRA